MQENHNGEDTIGILNVENGKKTIQDVADALGISKTTVSRAISGKGRIGEETKKRVFEYIEKYGYTPNPIAKSLAQQRTYNIGWIMPGDSSVTEMPFFQKCMSGVCEEAAKADYDILLSMIYEHSTSSLERMVNGRKVDGIILGRTLVEDKNVSYLKTSGIPFVAIGSTTQSGTIQVDNNHIDACRELTMRLISQGVKSMVLIGGNDEHVVNHSRREGYELGILKSGKKIESNIFMNSENEEKIGSIVDDALKNKVDCLVCMDDKICSIVVEILSEKKIRFPETVKVASFYNSELIAKVEPSITALQFNPRQLGMQACKTLVARINGDEVPEKTYMSYEVIEADSTKNIN